MAKAPEPGQAKKREEAEAATEAVKAALRIKFGEWDVIIHPGNVPIGEKIAVRKALGIPYESFLPSAANDAIGEDALFVMWWLARRRTEPGLTYELAASQWPTDKSAADFDIEFTTGDDSPEA